MEKVFVPLLATRFGIASTFFTEYLRTSNRSCLAIVLRWCGVSVCISIMSCHKSLAAPILAHQATVCRNLSYSFQLSKYLVLSQWLSATRFFSLSLSHRSFAYFGNLPWQSHDNLCENFLETIITSARKDNSRILPHYVAWQCVCVYVCVCAQTVRQK